MAEFKVIVVGAGGREFAYARKLLFSPDVRVTVAPGLSAMPHFLNEDMASRLTLRSTVKANDIPAMVQLAREIKPDLVVIGPEDPLIMGLANSLTQAGFNVFGFNKNGALLEGSKRFCKDLYRLLGFPTANAQYVYDPKHGARLIDELKNNGQPFVLKSDGPAMGKGVIIVPLDHPDYWEEQKRQLALMFDHQKPLGFCAHQVLLEYRYQILNEWSAMNILGSNRFCQPLMPTKDHKLFNGLNTGGMGIVTPAPGFGLQDMISRMPVVARLQDHWEYEHHEKLCGILYEGLNRMLNVDYLVEVNARGGDPETQGQLEFLEGAPLHEILLAAVEGRLEIISQIRVPEDKVLVGVVIASKGYPGDYSAQKGKKIIIPNLSEDVIIFPAGLAFEGGNLFAAGGRLCMVVGKGKTVEEARGRAYQVVFNIQHDSTDLPLAYRKNIGDEFGAE